MRSTIISFFLIIPLLAFGQIALTDDFQFRNIGPANQGGRIVDIEAVNDDFKIVYAAAASGGVWKSMNAGTTWDPIFDNYETASIGDIAIDQSDPSTIWVGTGEANNRNSVSWGNGIYKSTDSGETFQNMGLESTHQIARVVVNAENSDDVCVCAIGHLWGYSGERGLFRTMDGGKSWKKVKRGLPNDGKTGCTDMVVNPNNNDVIYTAFYHRKREPWHFEGGGEKGGIYKSSNGGKSWDKLSNGLPAETGRIGLAISASNPNVLVAIVEAEKTDDLSKPGSGIYRSEDAGATWKYVNTYNNRPFYYSQIRINPHDDQRVYVLTTRFMVSEDGGHNFKNGSPDYEIHGDFHAMWLDPNDADRYYIGADKGMSLTYDHGQHFLLFDNFAIGQFYRINYDMRDPYYVLGGFQDNGSYATASFTRDARGILNDSNWKMHWGDGQNANVNPTDWTEVYTSMENGSFFRYNAQTHEIKSIRPNPGNTANFYNYISDTITDVRSAIRFNWSAPHIMSKRNYNTIYAAANYVFKSTDKGLNWSIISPDLTTNNINKRTFGRSGGITPDNTGAETHCSITSLELSPINEQIIWVGTDDGNVQLTKNGGQSWKNLRSRIPEVPEGIWVSRVEASHTDPGSAYVSFDGHRSDDNRPWVFKTSDYGQSWQKITSGFKSNEVIRVVIQDHINPSLLFAGTETGVYMTLNEGASWQKMGLGLPTVSVLDLKIHERENDLIVGTHGRSLYVLDDISPLQQASDISPSGAERASIHLFDQKTVTLWHNVSRGGQRGHFWFGGENPDYIENTSSVPRAGFKVLAPITFYSDKSQNVELTIKTNRGDNSKTINVDAKAGVNRYYWDREFEVIPYSDEEYKSVIAALDELYAVHRHSRYLSVKRRFLAAETPLAQRKVIEPLTGGYRSFDLGPLFQIPRADVGAYQLSIKMGDEVITKSLHVRADPLDN